MENLIQDIRYGLRMLWKSPGFAAVAVLTLALGIGVNSLMFSLVNSVILRRLPFPEADRLMLIFHSYERINMPRASVSAPGYREYRERLRSFESVAAFTTHEAPMNMTHSGTPELVEAVLVTGNFFSTLGIQPALGRPFSSGDEQPGNRIAVLSHQLWQQRFGADPQVVGKKVRLDGADYEIVGVMPGSFRFPHNAELWVPVYFTPERLAQQMEYLNVVARLRAGVTREQAESEMAALAADLRRQYNIPDASRWTAVAVPMHQEIVGDVRPALLLLLGAVACVLLIACANVANLLLARGAARQKEIGIRVALGAGRLRIVRQLLTEGVLLGLAGGALGMLLAYWGLDALLRIAPFEPPSFIEVRVDTVVLWFTLGIAVLSGLLFSALPALQITRSDVFGVLKEGGRTSAAAGRQGLRSALVVGEVALALVLLAGAGLLIRTFYSLQSASLGFHERNLLTAMLILPQEKSDPQRVRLFFDQFLERARAIPGVEAVGLTSTPLLSTNWSNSFEIEGRELSPLPHAHASVANTDLPQALGMPIVRGRWFTAQDSAESVKVAVIEEQLARAYWGDEDPIGRRIIMGGPGSPRQAREIVGVVGNIRHKPALSPENKGMLYLPYPQVPAPFTAVVVRTSVQPENVAAPLRRAVSELDPDQALVNARSLDALLDEYYGQARLNMVLLGMFAGLALLLAAVGIYGVISYSVAQRTQEIGVRMALGAQRVQVFAMLLRSAAILAGIGLALGLAGSFAATRLMRSMLFGVSPTDPLTLVAIVLLLGAVALAASVLPARRATRVDPMVALRYE